MRFVSFLRPGFAYPELGILGAPGKILAYNTGCTNHGIYTPYLTDVQDLIQAGPRALHNCQKLLELFQAGDFSGKSVLDEGAVKLCSPVLNPKSVRDGYAFRQHVESARKGRGLPMIPEFDNFPVFYFTNALAVTGPGPVVVHPKGLDRLDFELEVAVVIGKEGRNIPANQADDYIFGYMIMNDWSARLLQSEEMKLNLGPAKGKDFASSFGPYLVTRDSLAQWRKLSEQGERFNLRMQAHINDKKVSEDFLQNMNWTFAQIIERASMGVTLYPGEVIASGTCGTGCLMELNGSKVTDNVWIRAGDRVTLQVEGLGRLDNTIVAGS